MGPQPLGDVPRASPTHETLDWGRTARGSITAARASLVDQQGIPQPLQNQSDPVQARQKSPPALAPRIRVGPIARQAPVQRRRKYHVWGQKGTPMQHTPRPLPQHGHPDRSSTAGQLHIHNLGEVPIRENPVDAGPRKDDTIGSCAESVSVSAVCTGTRRALSAMRRRFLACSSVGQCALRSQGDSLPASNARLHGRAKGTRRLREGHAQESDTCDRPVAKRLRFGPDKHGLDGRGWHFRWPPPGGRQKASPPSPCPRGFCR